MGKQTLKGAIRSAIKRRIQSHGGRRNATLQQLLRVASLVGVRVEIWIDQELIRVDEADG